MIRFFAIGVLVIIFLGFATPALAAPRWWPLVPCGLNQIPEGKTLEDGYTLPCNRCDLLRLLKNIIDFLLLAVTPTLATLMLVVAGFRIELGGALPAQQAAGQKMFWDIFKIVAGIFATWLIVNTAIKSLPLKEDVLPTEWWKFECTYTPVDGAPLPSPGNSATPAPSGQVPTAAQQGAKDLIAAIGAGSFSTGADCGGSFNARQNIQDMANGILPAVCSNECRSKTPACAPNGTVVNGGLLQGLVTLRQAGYGFTVTSLLTGVHSKTSSHYAGRGVDIVPSGDRGVWQKVRDKLRSIGGNAICETTSGVAAECSVSTVDHIHWTYP